MRATWFGHATLLLETGGVRLLTDPVLRGRLAHLRRHAPRMPPPVADAVLVSHVHQDHLDRPSLRLVAGSRTAVVVPRGAERLVAGLGFTTVTTLLAGEAADVGGVEIRAVAAWHEARRRPGSPVVPSLGFVVDRAWFAGDTGLDPAMEDLRGEVDVAFVPVWGWGPSLGPGHMDPDEAARAVALVAPAIAVPIHWGTFLPLGLGRRHVELLTEPPLRFAAEVARIAPATTVVIPDIGVPLELGGPQPGSRLRAGAATPEGTTPAAKSTGSSSR